LLVVPVHIRSRLIHCFIVLLFYFQGDDGMLDKTSFNARSVQCEVWFREIMYDGVMMPRWRAAITFFDPVEDGDGEMVPNPATVSVWECIEPLRNLYMKMYPSPEEQAMIGPLTLQYFVAFRLRYKEKDVHFYLHYMFGHLCSLMQRYKSVGLLRNEAEEGIMSEDKVYVEGRTHRYGCGYDLCEELIDYYQRKIFRRTKDAFDVKVDKSSISWNRSD
jgi:hypothetical protein